MDYLSANIICMLSAKFKKPILTPFLAFFTLCLVVSFIAAVKEFIDAGWGPILTTMVLVIFVGIPLLILVEQAIVRGLRKRIGIVLVMETLLLITTLILLSRN